MSQGLATKMLLEQLTREQEEVALGPESFGLQFKRLPDPHDVEGRKWLRRALITLCAIAFVLVFMPDSIRVRLNAWVGTPVAARAAHAPVVTVCKADWRERGCLVCEHRAGNRTVVKSTHC